MSARGGILIEDAAKQLGFGRKKLFALLRQRGLLGSANIATRRSVEQGVLRNEYRSFRIKGTDIVRGYTVALVTETGIALLQELVDEAVHEVPRLRNDDGRASRNPSSGPAG